MKNSIHIAAVPLMMMTLGTYAVAAEHTVACSTLPTAVQQKSKLLVDGATVRACIQDSSKGKTTFEMELLKNGRTRDLTFDSDGNLLEVEEQIDFATLPKPVAAAMQKEAGAGHLGKIESLTRGGVLVSYETTVTHNGKRREIAFHPDGSAKNAD